MLRYAHSSRPGCLEIESSGESIDIQSLPGKEQSGVPAALKARELHFLKADSAAGYELFLESCSSGNRLTISAKSSRQAP